MRSLLRDLLLPFALVLVVTAVVLFYVGRGVDRDALVRAPETTDGGAPAREPMIDIEDEDLRGARRETTAEAKQESEPPRASEAGAPPVETDPPASAALAEEDGLDLPAESEFEALYGSMSIPELDVVYESLNSQVQDAASEAYRARFEAGQYEVLGYGDELAADIQDRDKLVSYQLVPVPGHDAREIRRVELLEDEYPEAYSLHRRAIWVFDEIRRKRRGE